MKDDGTPGPDPTGPLSVSLARNPARRQAMLDALPDLMFVIRRDGVLLDYRAPDPTELHVEAERFVGKKLGDVLPTDVAERCLRRVQKALERRSLEIMEYRLSRLEEALRDYEARIAPSGSDEVLVVVRDITDRKRVEASLEERVRHRTSELAEANASLHAQIAERLRAEETLRQSEWRFRQLATNIREVFWIAEPGKQILYISPAYEQVWGRTVNELYDDPRSWLEAIHPEDRESAALTLEQQLQRTNTSVEYRIVRPDGSIRWIWDRGFPVDPSSDGKLVYTGIAEDITERKLHELNLQLTQFSVDRAADSIFWIDREARISYANEAACSALGYTRQELESMTIREIDPDYSRSGWDRHWESIKQAGQRVVESRHRAKDGSIFRVEISTHYQVHGGTEYVCAFARNIEARKRDEQELRARARQQAAVAELGQRALASEDVDALLAEAVEVVDRTLEVDYVKVLELMPGGVDFRLVAGLGWTPGLVGSATVPGGAGSQAGFTLSSSKPVIVEDLAAESRFSGPALLRDHGVTSGVSVLIHGRGRPFGLLAVHTRDRREFTEHDVNFLQSVANVLAEAIRRKQAEQARRELEAQMQHAQKLESLGVLAGGIAHDFNNFLMAILANAEMALSKLAPADPARAYLRQVSTAAERAATLTKQMLAYSGRGKFVIQPLDASLLVKEISHLLEVSISKQVTIQYGLAGDLPAVEADAGQLRQIVMNLITNASEAIGERTGLIRVGTGVVDADREYLSRTYVDDGLPAGRYVYIEVTDSGCGMDAETRAKIFDPFFTTKFTGRGLGLAAVLGIVRGHHGALSIDSEPGRGTTFRVLFPASEIRPDAKPSRGDEAARWLGDGLVLVVDDEEQVRDVTRRMLESRGFSVLTARDGIEALEVFRERADEVDLVLLDLTMPRMGGEETFRRLAELRPGVKTILSSGYGEHDVAERLGRRGLADFIQKPYRPGDLFDKVRRALEDGPSS